MDAIWTIRRATPGDAQGLTACIAAAYEPILRRGIRVPPVTEGVDADIAENLVWVAEAAGRIVGGIVMSLHDDHGHVANLAVDPALHRSGIGRSLIATAEACIIRRGLPELQLATHAELPENVALYERLGWSVTGGRADCVFMRKSLLKEDIEG